MNGAMSREAMLAGLQDIRLPAEAAGGIFAELAVAIGFAAVAALFAVAMFRLLGSRRVVARPQTLSQRIAALDDLPDEDRRLALLHLLKSEAPDRYASFSAELYRPNRVPLKDIEAEVARLV